MRGYSVFHQTVHIPGPRQENAVLDAMVGFSACCLANTSDEQHVTSNIHLHVHAGNFENLSLSFPYFIEHNAYEDNYGKISAYKRQTVILLVNILGQKFKNLVLFHG